MTEETKNCEQEIDILHALKTAFSQDGDSELFLAQAADQIRQVEAIIIETCAKHRIRIDDNLYALLESRDAISEKVSDLDKCTKTASETTTTVNEAINELSDKVTIRRNLDAALAVAAKTRKLTRMYARIEDVIDARRLYAAFRMLKLLEEETRSIQPNTVLSELVPDTRQLRSRIMSQVRRSLATWFVTVRNFEQGVGAYALQHATAQVASHQTLLDTPRGALGEPFALLPLLPPAPPRGRGAARPWRPMLTLANAPSRFIHGHDLSLFMCHSASCSHDTSTRPEIGRGDVWCSHVVSDRNIEVPALYLRPLLHAVHVADGLNLLSELRTDYCRERLAHLQRILDERDDELGAGVTTDVDGTNGELNRTVVALRDGDSEMDLEKDGDNVIGNRNDISRNGNTGNKIGNDTKYSDYKSKRNNVHDKDGVSADDASANSGCDNRPYEDSDVVPEGESNAGRGSVSVTSTQLNMSRAQRIKLLVSKVAGFFIVERTVEMHSTYTMVPREVVDSEWWSLAYAKLLAAFKEHEENGLESAADKARVRGVEENLERFAEVNGLIK